MFGRRPPPPPRNLLDFVPIPRVQAEVGEDGRVTLLRPKFTGRLMGRWLQPRLSRPYLRVHLDEIGSGVWQLINGARTVGEIAAELERRFGDRVKPAHERVALFVQEMQRGDMVELRGGE